MIPYDIDPSLHDHEPDPPVLDDGFSAPAPPQRDAGPAREAPAAPRPQAREG